MGVKDLMARFEVKDSPPDRGRSPGPGLVGSNSGSPSDSPRPLSKVRTSFVAIEKDGRMGLRRDPSGDSTYSSRRLSNDTEGTTPAALHDRSNVFEQDMAKSTGSGKTDLSKEPIPESPRRDSPAKEIKTSPKKGGLAPNPNPDKMTDEEEPQTKLTMGDPTVSAAIDKSGTGTNGSLNGSADKSKNTSSSKAAPKATPKVTPVSTTKTTTKPPAKSPVTARAPKSPAKEITKTPNKAPEKKKTTTPAATKAEPSKQPPASRPSTSGSAKKPASIELSPGSTGFVKPRPKSPTRPIKLPASLTTHTASSASKGASGLSPPSARQSLSRASGNINTLSVPASTGRSPSRASTTSTRMTTQKTQNPSLRRQKSTINRPRPSIGPPPKQAAKDHPPAKREVQTDDSFLARMMRPTQSSSSKTSDKSPVTPPRKQATSASAATRKPVSDGSPKKTVGRNSDSGKVKAKEAEKVVKKPVGKVAEKNHGTPKTPEKKEEKKEVPTAKEVAPVVAQQETANEAIEVAKVSHETATTPLVEEKEPIPSAESEPKLQPVEESKPEASAPTSEPEPAEETQEAVDEPKVEDSVTELAETSTTIEAEPASEPAAAAEEESSVKGSVPAITEDPEKVEDIEEIIHETKPEPIAEEPEAEAAVSETEAPAAEDPKVESLEDSKDLLNVTNGTPAKDDDKAVEGQADKQEIDKNVE